MTAFPSQPPDAAPTLASAAQPSSAFTASVLAPSSVRAMMSREQAQCDLDELARVIRTRSSYALSVSFPIATAIAAVRSSLPSQVAVAIDARAGQGQAGVAGVEFVVALLDDQSLHVFTCQVSFLDRRILINF